MCLLIYRCYSCDDEEITWTKIGGKNYWHSGDEKMTFYVAVDKCQSICGHLAIFPTEQEWAAIKELVGNKGEFSNDIKV